MPTAPEVAKPVRKLRRLLRRARKTPTPEEVHDLRTVARRYESIVEALYCDVKRNERRSLRSLRRIRSRAGKVRDLDVLTGNARKLEVPGEQDCLVLLLEALGADRKQAAKRLKGMIDRTGQRLRQRLKRTEARLRKRIEQDDGSARSADADVAAIIISRAEELAAPARLNRQTLHPYRLKVKELRDVAQVAVGDREDRLIRVLGDVKDAIGDWHDWERLTEIAGDTVAGGHGRQCALPREMKSITERKCKRALSMGDQLRKRLAKALVNRPSAASNRAPAFSAKLVRVISNR